MAHRIARRITLTKDADKHRKSNKNKFSHQCFSFKSVFFCVELELKEF